MMENAKNTIDTLLAYESRIAGGDRMARFGTQASEAPDIMMDRDFTDFIAQLDMSGFTAVPEAARQSNAPPGESPVDFRRELEIASYESLQALTLTLLRTERFSPGLMNRLYHEGWFQAFFSKLRSFKDER